jgi:carboxylesterase type B
LFSHVLEAKNKTETYSINETTIDCLRSISFPKLIDIQNKVLAKTPFSLFTPVVDGEFLTDPPMDIVDNLKFGPYSDLLIGSNAMEGASILWSFSDKFNISLDKIRKKFTIPVIKKFLLSRVPKEFQEYIDLVLGEAFPKDELNVNNSIQMWFQFVKIVGDLLQVCTDEYFIEKFTESGRNIYYYQFKPRPSKISLFNSTKWFDLAEDFDETPFIFGYPLNKKNSYTDEEILLSKRLMTYWTRFAKKGYSLKNYVSIF